MNYKGLKLNFLDWNEHYNFFNEVTDGLKPLMRYPLSYLVDFRIAYLHNKEEVIEIVRKNAKMLKDTDNLIDTRKFLEGWNSITFILTTYMADYIKVTPPDSELDYIFNSTPELIGKYMSNRYSYPKVEIYDLFDSRNYGVVCHILNNDYDLGRTDVNSSKIIKIKQGSASSYLCIDFLIIPFIEECAKQNILLNGNWVQLFKYIIQLDYKNYEKQNGYISSKILCDLILCIIHKTDLESYINLNLPIESLIKVIEELSKDFRFTEENLPDVLKYFSRSYKLPILE